MVTIEGLLNSRTADGTIPLTCDTGCCNSSEPLEVCGIPLSRQACPLATNTTCGASYFGGEAAWEQRTGKLRLFVSKKMYAGDQTSLTPKPIWYTVSFQLKNPLAVSFGENLS